MERSWFRRGFAEQPADRIYCTAAKPDADFEDASAASAELDLAAGQREVELARAAVDERSLDEIPPGRGRSADTSLRWIYLHMIGGTPVTTVTPTWSGS